MTTTPPPGAAGTPANPPSTQTATPTTTPAPTPPRRSSTMNDEMGDVFDAIDHAEPSSAWIPETAGDEISGIVEGTMTRSNQYGEFPVVVLGTRDRATRRVSGFSGALRKRIEDAKLQPGDGVKIVYTGWQKAMKDGKPIEYKGFELAVIRAARLAELRGEHEDGNGVPAEAPAVTLDPQKDLRAF